MKKNLIKILGGLITVALIVAAVVAGTFGNRDRQQINGEAAEENVTETSETATESQQEELSLNEREAQESENAEAEKTYDPLSIVVKADSVMECDREYVVEETEDGEYVRLTFADEETASEALDKYRETVDSETEYLQYYHIMDTGLSDYSYHSTGPEYINSGDAVDDILTKYGSADKVAKVKVAVIDTGINYDHVWLKDYVDTTHSYNFADNKSDASDDDGHGSNVSSIIVDTAYSNVVIYAYKVTDSDGYATDLDMYNAISRGIRDGVDVINISMGGPGEVSYMRDIIKQAVSEGIPVVVAAGNEATDTGDAYPANYPEAVTVAAMDCTGEITYFSNYGERIDLSAPGYNILGATIGGNTEYYTESMSGTSQATPFVTAACALVKTLYPSLNAVETEQVLKDNATDLGEPGFDILYGYGALNLSGLTLPTIQTKGGGYDSEVTVEITGYDPEAVIYYTTDGTIPVTIDGQTNGTKYTEPFTITESATVTAVARINETTDSKPVSEDYYIGGQSIDSKFTIDSASGMITGYTGNQTALVVPSEIGGTTVTGIAAGAFDEANAPYASSIEIIVLADGIKTVEENAFCSCSSLKYVVCKSGQTDRDKINISSTGNSCFINAYWSTYPGLVVISEPDSTSYITGDIPDLEGGKFIYIDSNRNMKTVSMVDEGVTVNGYSSTTVGEQTVTIGYMGQSTTIRIEFQDREKDKIRVSISAVGYTITDPGNTDEVIAGTGKKDYYYDPETTITLTYADDSTLFAVWCTASGTVLSSSEEYTFTPTEDIRIYGLHTSCIITGDEILAIYKGPYGQIVKAVEYTTTDLSADDFEFPAAPYYLGYTFKGWSIDKSNIIDKNDIVTIMKTSNTVEIYPKYKKDTSKTHKVNIYIQGTQKGEMDDYYKKSTAYSGTAEGTGESEDVYTENREEAASDRTGCKDSCENTGYDKSRSEISDNSSDSYVNENDEKQVTDSDSAGNSNCKPDAPTNSDSNTDTIEVSAGDEGASETSNSDADMAEDSCGESATSESSLTDSDADGAGLAELLETKGAIYINEYKDESLSRENIQNSKGYKVSASDYEWEYTDGSLGGITFQYWKDRKNNILSFSKSLTYYSAVDVDIIAVYAQYGFTTEVTPLISISQVSGDTLTGTSADGYNLSFMEYYYLPEGSTLVRVGYVETASAAKATENKLVLGENSVNVLSSSRLNQLEGTFIQDITTKDPDKTVYMRGFLQYKEDGSTEVKTLYSDIASGSYNSLN